jgi:cytochrome c-type biogenesis protein CcmH/NrfG
MRQSKRGKPMPHILSYLVVALFALISFATSPAQAVGTSDAASESEVGASAYAEAKASIDVGNFIAALPILLRLTVDEPRNADAWNLLGFTQRKLGEFDAARVAYDTALTINPGHLGALEYQGELFLQTGAIDKAKVNLETLRGLCGGCDEFGDLEAALKAAGQS